MTVTLRGGMCGSIMLGDIIRRRQEMPNLNVHSVLLLLLLLLEESIQLQMHCYALFPFLAYCIVCTCIPTLCVLH